MSKPLSSRRLLSVVVLALMYVVAAVVWDHVPDRLPVHWDSTGRATRFGGRVEGLLVLPITATWLFLLLTGLSRVAIEDRDRVNTQKTIATFALALVVFMALLHASTIAAFFGLLISPISVLPFLLGALQVVLGGALGRVSRNGVFGIRTPWSLADPENWSRTHRFARRAFLGSGLATLAIAGMRTTWGTLAATAFLVAAGLAAAAYSGILHARKSARRASR